MGTDGAERKMVLKGTEEMRVTEGMERVRENQMRGLGRRLVIAAAVLLTAAMMLLFSSCTGDADEASSAGGSSGGLQWWELRTAGSMELLYAHEFSVDYYEGGYSLIKMSDDSRFLLLPEDAEVPGGLDDDITVLKGPVDSIYLAASAVMDHFCKLDALDAIALSGTKADSWYIEEARQAMEDGNILYAGKYSAPDYEMILESGCGLAIESTMIFHAPEVKEQMEARGIPVLVDYSSYESHPLGRSEWIKLYGLLTGREEQAEAVFQEQVEKLNAVTAAVEEKRSGDEIPTVAFFYITSSGGVNVRKSGDYVSEMIQMAGGDYVFDHIDSGDTATATETIQMEDFYAGARDADYLIYNSTIDGEIETVDQLMAKSSLLADFKAVKSGNVYCTGKNMYQETTETGTMTYDIYQMLYGGETAEMRFLYKLK